jgi:hypothetical protein
MPDIAHFSRCSSLMVGRNGNISEHVETKLCIERLSYLYHVHIIFNFLTDKYGSFTALQITFMLFLSVHVLSSWH